MSDQTVISNYRTQAAQAYADYVLASNIQAAEMARKRREDDEREILERLENTLGISPDQVTFFGAALVYARVAELEGIHFYLGKYHERVRLNLWAKVDLPPIPIGSAFEEWWKNPRNQNLPDDMEIDGWVDVGCLLNEIQKHGEITIHPWPAEPPSPTSDTDQYDVITDGSLLKRLNQGWELVAVLQPSSAEEYGEFLVRRLDAESQMTSNRLAEAEAVMHEIDTDLGEAIKLLRQYATMEEIQQRFPSLQNQAVALIKRVEGSVDDE